MSHPISLDHLTDQGTRTPRTSQDAQADSCPVDAIMIEE